MLTGYGVSSGSQELGLQKRVMLWNTSSKDPPQSQLSPRATRELLCTGTDMEEQAMELQAVLREAKGTCAPAPPVLAN